MRAVIQRVKQASVTVNHQLIAKIDKGLLIFLGVFKEDSSADAKYLANKIIELRIFNDQNKKMNLCAKDVLAQFLVVPQFTLCAELSGSRRPSFERAALPQPAEKLYLEFIEHLKGSQLKVEQGVFKEYMAVCIENDGPVTFVLDSEVSRP